MTELSVTRAAQAVGVTQSAMSHSLARLRELLADPLFVRAPGGIRPTARAAAVAPEVRSALSMIEGGVLTASLFDTATAKRVFDIAMSDFIEVLLLPPLMARLSAAAPNIDVVVHPTDRMEARDVLDIRRLDLAVGALAPLSASHRSIELWDERVAVLHPRGAAGPSGVIDVASLAAGRHAMFARRPEGSRALLDRLAEHGIPVRRVVTTPHLMTLPYLVRTAGMFATVPASLASHLSQLYGLGASLLPQSIMPGFPISLVWDASSDDDPAHRYLRGAVADIGRAAAPAWGPGASSGDFGLGEVGGLEN